MERRIHVGQSQGVCVGGGEGRPDQRKECGKKGRVKQPGTGGEAVKGKERMWVVHAISSRAWDLS